MTQTTHERLEARLQDLLAFIESIELALPTATDIDDELRSILKELTSVLDVYSWELTRQLEGRLATSIYFRFLILKSLDAYPIKSALFEKFPVLAKYNPANAPRDFPQQVVKHLLDAIETFTQAKADLSSYLPVPHFPGLSEQVALAETGTEPTEEMLEAWEKELASILRVEIQEAEIQSQEWQGSQEQSI
jgi:hypothetical protein